MAETVAYIIDDDFTLNVEEDTDDVYNDLGIVPEVPSEDPVETSPKEESFHEDISYENSQPLVNKQPNPAAIKSSKERRILKCELCGYQTVRASTYEAHMKLHADPTRPMLYKCEYCDYGCFNKSSLSSHMGRCDGNKRKFKCPQCDFHTIKRRNLKFHALNMHNAAKPKIHRCRKCSFNTENFEEYNKHTKSEHKHKCSVCEYTAEAKYRIEKHMKTHKAKVKSVRVYQCDICSYESLWPTNVARHRERHHDEK